MKRLFLVIFGALLCAGVHAQTTKERLSGFVYAFEMRGSNGNLSLNDHSEFGVAEYEALPGYAFSRRFAIYLPISGSLGLFNQHDVKSYEFTGQIGAGIGYSPLHTTKDQLELNAKIGSALGGDWRFVYYDFGLRYNFGGYKSCRNIYLGLGVRYYDCFKGGFADYCNMYVALGFKFNSYKIHTIK